MPLWFAWTARSGRWELELRRSHLVVLAVVCAVILAVPPQIHEIYRSMAEAVAIGMPYAWVEPLLSGTAVAMLCWGIFLVSEVNAAPRPPLEATSGGNAGWVAVAQLPLLGAAIGIYLAKIDVDKIDRVQAAMARVRLEYMVAGGAGTADEVAPIADRFARYIMQFDDHLLRAALICGGIALVSMVVLTALVRKGYCRHGQRSIASAVLVVSALLIGLLTIDATRVVVARTLMPVPLIATALFLGGFWLSWLGSVGRRRGLPLSICILLAAFLFAALDLNDGNRVRSLPGRSAAARLNIQDQFRTWMQTRTDFATYDGRKYPIYLVAAQGGGIYAAYHAASFLAGTQDQCPRFGSHIFAISGVSGGSVGASVFASLLHQAHVGKATDLVGDRPCSPDRGGSQIFQDAVDELLSEDFLTPLLGGFLFTSPLQQVLPFPIESLDRARALELSLEQSWDRVIATKQFSKLRGDKDETSHPLSGPMTAIWQPSRSSVPALVLNTTEVATGRRRLIAPFEFPGIDISFLPVWGDSDQARRFPDTIPNVALSTGAFLSSRFPWVTPAGFFEEAETGSGRTSKVRVVDGGYFENSGLATALDLMNAIETAVETDPTLKPLRGKIEFNIISLNSKKFDLGTFSGFGEWMSPVSTMMSTRNARAPLETSRARLMVERSAGSSDAIAKRFLRFDIDGLGYPLPLGWRLSAVTRLLISSQLGDRFGCTAAPPGDTVASADCLKKTIANQLSVE
jgi:hypothetical protein